MQTNQPLTGIKKVYTNPVLITAVGLTATVNLPLAGMIAATPLIGWGVAKTFQAMANGISSVAGHAISSAESAYRRGRRNYKPQEVVVYAIPDRREEEGRNIEQLYARNVDLIERSRLPQDAKDELLRIEMEEYERRLTQLLS